MYTDRVNMRKAKHTGKVIEAHPHTRIDRRIRCMRPSFCEAVAAGLSLRDDLRRVERPIMIDAVTNREKRPTTMSNE